MSHSYSTEELQELVQIAARIVVEHGEAYLPIFNRVHREYELSKQQTTAKNLAFQLAKSYAEKE